MKHCRDCGQDKPLSEFNKRKDRPCGVVSYCKACMAKRWRRWAYGEAA